MFLSFGYSQTATNKVMVKDSTKTIGYDSGSSYNRRDYLLAQKQQMKRYLTPDTLINSSGVTGIVDSIQGENGKSVKSTTASYVILYPNADIENYDAGDVANSCNTNYSFFSSLHPGAETNIYDLLGAVGGGYAYVGEEYCNPISYTFSVDDSASVGNGGYFGNMSIRIKFYAFGGVSPVKVAILQTLETSTVKRTDTLIIPPGSPSQDTTISFSRNIIGNLNELNFKITSLNNNYWENAGTIDYFAVTLPTPTNTPYFTTSLTDTTALKGAYYENDSIKINVRARSNTSTTMRVVRYEGTTLKDSSTFNITSSFSNYTHTFLRGTNNLNNIRVRVVRPSALDTIRLYVDRVWAELKPMNVTHYLPHIAGTIADSGSVYDSLGQKVEYVSNRVIGSDSGVVAKGTDRELKVAPYKRANDTTLQTNRHKTKGTEYTGVLNQDWATDKEAVFDTTLDDFMGKMNGNYYSFTSSTVIPQLPSLNDTIPIVRPDSGVIYVSSKGTSQYYFHSWRKRLDSIRNDVYRMNAGDMAYLDIRGSYQSWFPTLTFTDKSIRHLSQKVVLVLTRDSASKNLAPGSYVVLGQRTFKLPYRKETLEYLYGWATVNEYADISPYNHVILGRSPFGDDSVRRREWAIGFRFTLRDTSASGGVKFTIPYQTDTISYQRVPIPVPSFPDYTMAWFPKKSNKELDRIPRDSLKLYWLRVGVQVTGAKDEVGFRDSLTRFRISKGTTSNPVTVPVVITSVDTANVALSVMGNDGEAYELYTTPSSSAIVLSDTSGYVNEWIDTTLMATQFDILNKQDDTDTSTFDATKSFVYSRINDSIVNLKAWRTNTGTFRNDSLNLISGTNITVSQSGNNVTINNTATAVDSTNIVTTGLPMYIWNSTADYTDQETLSTSMSFSCVSGKKYAIEVTVFAYTSNSSFGSAYGFDFPDGSDANMTVYGTEQSDYSHATAYHVFESAGSTGISLLQFADYFFGKTESNKVFNVTKIEAFITAGDNGTIAFQFRSEASGRTVYISDRTWMVVKRLN